MAHIVILGAGIGGMTMAYEMREQARPQDKVTVVSNHDFFQFTPSNPWVAVNWRSKESITIPAVPYLEKKNIGFIPVGARRVHPDRSQLELVDDRIIDYDFLVIATGPKLAFEEVEGLGPEAFTQSVCHVDHAVQAGKAWDSFVEDPGPIVVGAVQGASCFGPAYEFAFIMDTDLRQRKIRDKVPMTFVTAEPYIGHLGLGGVGDSKGLLESSMRHHHIKWICNAKVTKVEAGKMFVAEHDARGEVIKEHELPFKYSMMLPAFKGIDAVLGIEGLANPRGFIVADPYQRNPTFPNVFSVGVCVAIPPVEATPVPTGTPKTGYMIETMVTATAHNIRAILDGREPDQKPTWNALCLGGLRRYRCGLRRAASNSSAQRQLVQGRQVGASGQGGVREVFHAQDEEGQYRAHLREVCARRAGHQETEAVGRPPPLVRRWPLFASVVSGFNPVCSR